MAPAAAAAMRSSIATYRESLSRLAVEVDDAAADEVPAPSAPAARGGDLSATPPSSGRRRRYSRPGPGTGPGSDTAEPDEVTLPFPSGRIRLVDWLERRLRCVGLQAGSEALPLAVDTLNP